MISFRNDYGEGAHESILEALAKNNRIAMIGYGEDEISAEAKALISKAIGRDCEVHFLVGGTQTNSTVIASLLRPHEGVVSAETGHIAQHESGAVEASGHKVLTLPTSDGKLKADEVRKVFKDHAENEIREHLVKPGMIYVSNPTELGTVYHKDELAALHQVAKDFGVPLFLDGARLGCALAAAENDMTLRDIADNTDIFYIGGTKNGALIGEAVVFSTPGLSKDFRYIEKQRGAMLAKGWILGIEYRELFKDGLYFRLAENAVRLAEKLTAGFKEIGVPLFVESPTNQVFIITTKEQEEKLAEKYVFEFWEPYDETHNVLRFVVSWAQTEENIASLLADAEKLWEE